MILSMFYNAQGCFQTEPAISINAQELASTLAGSTDGPYTSNSWDKRVFKDLGDKLPSSNEANTPRLRAIYTLTEGQVAAGTELWLRVLASTKKTTLATTTSCGSFVDILDAAGKVMLSIGAEGTTGIYAKIYKADGTISQELFPAGSLPTANFPVDTANKRVSLDFRIKLHEVAGFIQIYGYTGNLLKEWVGPTITTEVGTRVQNSVRMYLSKFGGSYDNLHEFSILADEPTQNMFVMPILPKAAGSLNGQLTGTYADVGGRLANIKDTGGVTLRLSGSEKKKFSVTGQTPSDVGLPENYVVKAVAVGATAEAVSFDGAPVPLSLLLKPAQATEFSAIPALPIASNLTAAAMRRAQNRFSLLNLNPATLAGWSVSDLAGLEFGVEVGG